MKTLNYKFVEKIPEIIEEGILYVSIPYQTAIHKCFCGCGNEVVTPLSPKQWILIYDGESVSLYPSIGNWSLKCRSHYFIKENKVIWAKTYSNAMIKRVKRKDTDDIKKFFNKK